MRKSGTFDIDVHYDPQDPRRIWFCDQAGIHEFKNLSRDPILVKESLFADFLAIQDDDHLQELITGDECDQAASNFVAGRSQQNDANRARKKDAIKNAGRKISKTELTGNIQANRLEEMKNIARNLNPVTRWPETLDDEQEKQSVPKSSSANDEIFGAPDLKEDALEDALAKFRRDQGEP